MWSFVFLFPSTALVTLFFVSPPFELCWDVIDQFLYSFVLIIIIDTPRDNFPLDLSSELLHCGFSIADRVAPALADKIWNQAFNFRLGTKGLRTIDLIELAHTRNISFINILDMVEMDEWVYSDGYSMVCDVFVCRMYKEGQLFGDMTDQFQCAELANYLVYAMKIFDGNYQRPQECVEADPSSPFCQVCMRCFGEKLLCSC